MLIETILYTDDEIPFKGYAVTPNPKAKLPTVLIAPAWRGQDHFAKEQAHKIADHGMVGFVLDLYGDGAAVTQEEAPSRMLPLFLDRPLLQKRARLGFSSAAKLPYVDPHRIGAMGFCFGGLTVLELLRSGENVKGIVSFHPVIGDELAGKKALTAPLSPQAKGACLILQGNDDPLVSKEALEGLKKELTQAKIDWQLHVYGGCMHAFTNPEAKDPANGNVYNPTAAKRSFTSTHNFFKEIL